MPTWPTTLQKTFNSDGLSVEEPDVLMESQPELGAPIVRRRTTAAPEILSGAITCDAGQAATFKSFLRVDTMGGALPFDGFTHPVDQTLIAAAAFKKASISYHPNNPLVDIQFTLYVLTDVGAVATTGSAVIDDGTSAALLIDAG